MSGIIPVALLAAYRAAEYRVSGGPDHFCLRVNEPSPALAALYTRTGRDRAAYLTACNPASHLWSEAANRAAHERLRQALDTLDVIVIEGEARDPSGRWPAEPSLLAVGLSREAARELARRFGQNACLWMDHDAVPRLLWVHDWT